MALEKYRQKRNFKAHPSRRAIRGRRRAGQEGAKPASGLFFCVQKHLASHLHYDFRLEHNGVLLSWAVPKGPSLDPKTKRLAMHVEDHPFEYGTFEGVIPEGYGAGIVMLWDQGTWTPEADDVDAALKKGDLKFTLDGYKLKGSWVLVRTGGRWGGGCGRRRRAELAADQAPRRLGGRRRHRRVRAAQRQERRRLRGHPRRRQSRHLGIEPAGQGRRNRARCSPRSSRRPRRSKPAQGRASISPRPAAAEAPAGTRSKPNHAARKQDARIVDRPLPAGSLVTSRSA